MDTENPMAHSGKEGLMWHPWPVFPFPTAVQHIGWLPVGLCGCHPPTRDGWYSVFVCGHMKWDRQTAKCFRNKRYDTKLSFTTIKIFHIQRRKPQAKMNKRKPGKQVKTGVTGAMYPSNIIKLFLFLCCANKKGRGAGNWLRRYVLPSKQRNLRKDKMSFFFF